jgi:hypothetical protein
MRKFPSYFELIHSFGRQTEELTRAALTTAGLAMSSYAFSYYGADTTDSAAKWSLSSDMSPAGMRDRGVRQAILTSAGGACPSNGELVRARLSVIGILCLVVRVALWR